MPTPMQSSEPMGPLQLEIQELESMETPDWITVGGLAAGTLISLAAVGFAVMT